MLARHVPLLLTGLLCCLGVTPSLRAQGHAMDKPPLNPEFLGQYEANAAEIKQLQDNVKNANRSDADRLADFKKLRSKYPDHALHVAAQLYADPSVVIAKFSVQLLGAAAVMSDHRMKVGHEPTAQQAYAMQFHEFAKTALRKAQTDDRKPVRDGATQSLASLSDDVGLKNIESATRNGMYSALEAVNHFGLAKPEAGNKYLSTYLKDEIPDVQAAAVNYLVNSPKYQKQIKEEILLNPKAAILARVTAAKHLSKDAQTALLLLRNETPPELFDEVAQTYLRANGTKFTKMEMESFKGIVDSYKKAKPGVELKGINKVIERIDKSKSR